MASYDLTKATTKSLVGAGFDKDTVQRALSRSPGDVNKAVDMLVNNRVPSEDAFDILASAEKPYSTPADKLAQSHARQPVDANKGGWRTGVASDTPVSAQLDVRLSRFLEMGFEVPAAEKALQMHNNDVDAALSTLLASGTPSPYGPSPHDELLLVTEAGAKGKKRADHKRAVDKNKGNFAADLPPGAPPSAILDARISGFLEMGFSPEDAESALAASNNDVDAALSLLLGNAASLADQSPHDVLAATSDPLGGTKKTRAPAARNNDPSKDTFREGLPSDAPQGAILDARLSRFLEMGFGVEDTERALAFCKNDVDAALTMLLKSKEDALSA